MYFLQRLTCEHMVYRHLPEDGYALKHFPSDAADFSVALRDPCRVGNSGEHSSHVPHLAFTYVVIVYWSC